MQRLQPRGHLRADVLLAAARPPGSPAAQLGVGERPLSRIRSLRRLSARWANGGLSSHRQHDDLASAAPARAAEPTVSRLEPSGRRRSSTSTSGSLPRARRRWPSAGASATTSTSRSAIEQQAQAGAHAARGRRASTTRIGRSARRRAGASSLARAASGASCRCGGYLRDATCAAGRSRLRDECPGSAAANHRFAPKATVVRSSRAGKTARCPRGARR